MIPLTCSNCWYNGLQYGTTVGLPIGYCAEHRKILERPYETTCGRLRRKDLPLLSARRQAELHQQNYSMGHICEVVSHRRAEHAGSSSPQSFDILRKDPVGDTVADFGELDAKIESLAQLRRVPGARAEIAMLSLGRSYVHRCIDRGGAWTSGLHLLWWTRQRLATDPDVAVADLSATSPLPLERRVELAKWSLVMLRLTLLDDMGHYAASNGSKSRVSRLRGIVQDAALAVRTFNVRRLLGWVRSAAQPRFDGSLSHTQYVKLAKQLHQSDAT